MGARQIDMAAPYPRRLLAEMADERQRLRIVDDHEVVVEMHPHGVLEHDLLVDLALELAQIDLAALERVVHLFGDAEEVGTTLDHPPAGPNPGGVHQQSQ